MKSLTRAMRIVHVISRIRLTSSQAVRHVHGQVEAEETIVSIAEQLKANINKSHSDPSTVEEEPTSDSDAGMKGVVTSHRDGKIMISGLNNAAFGSVLGLDSGATAVVSELYRDSLCAIIITGDQVSAGTEASILSQAVDFPVGSQMDGRVVDGIGRPLDGADPLEDCSRVQTLSMRVPGITTRRESRKMLVTGLTKIDCLNPIRLGERVVFLGNVGTGKTTTALNCMINHAKSSPDARCIYTSSSIRSHEIAAVLNLLKSENVLPQFSIIASGECGGSQYLGPLGACALADFQSRHGRDVIICYDDIIHHCALGEELNFSANSGSAHVSLLESAGYFGSTATGSGSVTAFTILDTAADSLGTHGGWSERFEKRVVDSTVGAVDFPLPFNASLSAEKKWPAINFKELLPRHRVMPETAEYDFAVASRAWDRLLSGNRALLKQQTMMSLGIDPEDEGDIDIEHCINQAVELEDSLHSVTIDNARFPRMEHISLGETFSLVGAKVKHNA